MKHLIFSFKLMILVCALTWISGCQYDPYSGDYTRSKPLQSEVAGTYVLYTQTLNSTPVDKLVASNGSKPTQHKLILRSDGTFSMINMPVWADDWSISKFSSGYGKWKIQIVGEVDEGNYTDKFWGIEFISKNIWIATPALMGETPPYDIIWGYGDPDGGNVMIYEKQNSNSK